MRKLIYSFMMLVLMLPLLAACGAAGTGEAGGSAAGSAAGSTAASTAASTGPTAASTEAPATDASASAATSAEGTAATETATTGAGGNGSGLRVALVTDVGKVNDGTFNQSAYEGMKRAESEFGLQTAFIETQAQADYEKNLEQFASQGYDLVIAVGFFMGDALKVVASRYPDVKFVIIDSVVEGAGDNVKGIVFQEDEAAYMVGALAALVSQTNNIGVVGGEKIPPVQKFVEGYKAGARSVKPDIQVQEVYIPNFQAPDQGAEAARSQIAEGADVIFGAGGPTGSGGIKAAAAEGAFAIGVDADEYNTTFNKGAVAGSDKLITSALKRIDNATYTVIQELVNGNFSTEPYVGTAANGGVDYAECHDACGVVTDEIQAQVDQIKQGLADGTIKTNVQIQ